MNTLNTHESGDKAMALYPVLNFIVVGLESLFSPVSLPQVGDSFFPGGLLGAGEGGI